MPQHDPRLFESHQEIIPFETIKERHFTIVGCGSLGTIAGRILARLGAHRFHLVDGEKVEIRHLNREVFTQDQIGTNKATALAYQLTGIHPKVRAITTARHYEVDHLMRGKEDILLLTTNDPSVPQMVLDEVNQWDRAERPTLFVARHTGLTGGYWMADLKTETHTGVPALPWLLPSGVETADANRRIATTAHFVAGVVGQAIVEHILGRRIAERVDLDLGKILQRGVTTEQKVER